MAVTQLRCTTQPRAARCDLCWPSRCAALAGRRARRGAHRRGGTRGGPASGARAVAWPPTTAGRGEARPAPRAARRGGAGEGPHLGAPRACREKWAGRRDERSRGSWRTRRCPTRRLLPPSCAH
eukprot:scaffold79687_cov36-Phaeocystis_antarctica.AAC.1